MKKIVLSLSQLLCSNLGLTQNEYINWYFGLNAGLNFSTSPPSSQTGTMNTNEACAAMSDASGNLLFYTNGEKIWNKNHQQMPNGFLMGGGSACQGVVAVKRPGAASIYDLFVLGAESTNILFSVSTIDMSLLSGLGNVVSTTTLTTPCLEKMVSVRHCNGTDYWIVIHEYGSNNFRSYLVNNSGVNNTPVISSVGAAYGGSISAIYGQMKISPNGRKLAVTSAHNGVPSYSWSSGVDLFDFDPSTGVVSNPFALLTGTMYTNSYGAEFSPDGSKLYSAIWNPGRLHQWDLCSGNNTAIAASVSTLAIPTNSGAVGTLQVAMDGKIYISSWNHAAVSVINNPNNLMPAIGFSYNVIPITPNKSWGGLPPSVNRQNPPFSVTVACQSVSFSPFSSSNSCAVSSNSITGYSWNFGNPLSGSLNSSTFTNAVHQYTAAGTYSPYLVIYQACANDTIRKTISIGPLTGSIAVIGPKAICKGEKRTYTAIGASTYTWASSAGNSTIILNPDTTTIYQISGTTPNGCVIQSQFSISVSKCSGVSETEAEEILIYPNPVDDQLFIESRTNVYLEVMDQFGALVYTEALQKGKSKVLFKDLPPGIYFVNLRSKENNQRFRLLKCPG